jgi:hypothetical protein
LKATGKSGQNNQAKSQNSKGKREKYAYIYAINKFISIT